MFQLFFIYSLLCIAISFFISPNNSFRLSAILASRAQSFFAQGFKLCVNLQHFVFINSAMILRSGV